MLRASSRRISQRGASAVEFAIVLPLLMVLVMGSLDWGHYFVTREVVVNAAREGARAGSLQVSDDAAADAAARATALDYLTKGSLVATKATLTVTVLPQSVSVSVSYPAGSLTGFSEILVPAQAVATAVMRR